MSGPQVRALAPTPTDATAPIYSAPAPVAPPAPVSTLDAVKANWTLAKQDQIGSQAEEENDAYQRIVARLDQFDNRSWIDKHVHGSLYMQPELSQVGTAIGVLGAINNHQAFDPNDAYRTPYDLDAVWNGMRQHPDVFGDILSHAKNPAEFSAYVQRQQTDIRHTAQATVAGESGLQKVVGFGTGVAAGLTDPINLGLMAATGGGGAVRTVVGGMAREALVNGAITAAQEPAMVANRSRFGETTTAGEAATDIAEGAAGGALLHGAVHGLGVGATALRDTSFGQAAADAAGRAVGSLGDAVTTVRTGFGGAIGAVKDAFGRSDAPAAPDPAAMGDAELAGHFSNVVPPEARTPDEQAALNIIDRDGDIHATNPYEPTPVGVDAHAANYDAAMTQLAGLGTGDPPAPVSARTTALGGTGLATGTVPNVVPRAALPDDLATAPFTAVKERIIGRESASAGRYNAVVYGLHAPKPVTSMTLGEVFDFQRGALRDQTRGRRGGGDVGSTGMGAYQFESRTLEDNARRTFGDSWRDQPFSPTNQDRIAETLWDRVRGDPRARANTWATFHDGGGAGAVDRPVLRRDAFASDADHQAASAALDASQRELDAADAAEAAQPDEPALANDDARDATDPAPQPTPTGNAEQVITSRGTRVDTRFEVHEARDLIDSSQPGFDQSLQPRDRAARAASDVQIAHISANLDPAQLASSRQAGQGAPIIGPDKMVESGNGRVAAIRRAYAELPEQAQSYRDMVEARAPQAATMDEPVLVRRRTTDMTPADRRAWVAEANERDTMGMSAEEQAQADARAITPQLMAQHKGGDLLDAGNRSFVRGFLDDIVPGSEHNMVTTKDGGLSAHGLDRINNAVLARAYTGSRDIVGQLASAADTNIKAIGDVMRDVAPAVSQLRDLIAAGRVDPQFDLSEPLADVARRVSHARDTKGKVNDIVDQSAMFGDGPSPEAAALLRLFFRADKDGKLFRPRAVDVVTEAVDDYIRVAAQGTDFFGRLPTAEELIYDTRAPRAGTDEPRFSAANSARDRAADDRAPSERPGRGGGAGSDRVRPARGPGDDLADNLAEARGENGPPPLHDPTLEQFSDPHGHATAAAADSLAHDLRVGFAAEMRAHTADSIIDGQRGITVDEAMRRATENQPHLAALGEQLARDSGAEWENPGVKKRGRVEQKFRDEGYADAGELKDIARGALIIDRAEQADAIVAGLGKHLPLYDKGWQVIGRTGYFDRKLIVRFRNGGVAELQIVPRAIWDAKKGGLGELYDRSRLPTTSPDESARLERQQREGYAAALAGSSFERITDKSAFGKARENPASVSSTPSEDALLTSPGASRHSPPDQTQALARDDSLTTGRSSTSKNSSDIGSSAPVDIKTDGVLDNGEAVDPALAERQRQEAALKAGSPMQARVDQEGTIGLGLFDAHDQPGFRLDEEGGERDVRSVLDELDADAAALQALKDCQ